MKLVELVSISETILESRVEAIQTLLDSKLKLIVPNIFNLWEVLVTENFNTKGNFTIITRVTLEHSGSLLKDELDKYAGEILKSIDSIIKSLLESKNNLFAHRSSMVKLL